MPSCLGIHHLHGDDGDYDENDNSFYMVMVMTAIAIGADDGDDGNDDDYIDLFQGRKVQSEAWRKRSNCDNSHFHKARWSCLHCQCFHRLVKLPTLPILPVLPILLVLL